jgi:MFS family permease
VLVPLVVADTTRGSGHFNFAQGVVGVAVGIGASIGTTIAGYVADMFANTAVFVLLASIGASGLILVLDLMPETRELLKNGRK